MDISIVKTRSPRTKKVHRENEGLYLFKCGWDLA